MTTWSEMKQHVEAQMDRDPQRATLSTRAIASVEEGLRHLTGVGYNFEIAPKGTLNELVEVRGPKEPELNPLSIAGSQKLMAKSVDPVNREFDAITAGDRQQQQY